MPANEPDLSVYMVSQLKDNLIKLSGEIGQLIHTLDTKESSVLNEFDEIHHLFNRVQVSTALDYLKSYLASFTDQFEVLSKAIQHFLNVIMVH